MYKKLYALLILLSFIFANVLTACSKPSSNLEVITIDQVIQNLEQEGLSFSTLDIPSEIVSVKAQHQAGYEIGSSGDKIFIYEYENNQYLNEDHGNIHNALNDLPIINPPMKMTRSNIHLIYLKKDKNEFEVENKLLQTF